PAAGSGVGWDGGDVHARDRPGPHVLHRSRGGGDAPGGAVCESVAARDAGHRAGRANREHVPLRERAGAAQAAGCDRRPVAGGPADPGGHRGPAQRPCAESRAGAAAGSAVKRCCGCAQAEPSIAAGRSSDSLSAGAGRKPQVLDAAMGIGCLVVGFTPMRDLRSLRTKAPKPAMVTFSSSRTPLAIASITASTALLASALVISSCEATRSIRSVLFMIVTSRAP